MKQKYNRQLETLWKQIEATASIWTNTVCLDLCCMYYCRSVSKYFCIYGLIHDYIPSVKKLSLP